MIITERVDIVLLVEHEGMVATTSYLQSLLFNAQIKEQGRGLSHYLDVLGWLGTLAVVVLTPEENGAVGVKGCAVVLSSRYVDDLY